MRWSVCKWKERVLSERDRDEECIDQQLKKARGRWSGMARILKREGANAICMGKFYIAIVQALLLYGADSWAVSGRSLRKLESFHK